MAKNLNKSRDDLLEERFNMWLEEIRKTSLPGWLISMYAYSPFYTFSIESIDEEVESPQSCKDQDLPF